MGHPTGGRGYTCQTVHSFEQAFLYVGSNGVDFNSTTGERIHAIRSLAADGVTRTITFIGEKSRHGIGQNRAEKTFVSVPAPQFHT